MLKDDRRCPGIDAPCPRAGRWLWTHRRGTDERYCLRHVTELLATMADEVATRMDQRSRELHALLRKQRGRA